MFVEYMWLFVIVFFFFFKQKTAYEMRISDWSSDVCSSDLQRIGDDQRQRARALLRDPDDRAVEQIGGRSRAQGPSLAVGDHLARAVEHVIDLVMGDPMRADRRAGVEHALDRKSTRLNSSH